MNCRKYRVIASRAPRLAAGIEIDRLAAATIELLNAARLATSLLINDCYIRLLTLTTGKP